jgi:hypothetical protein
LEGKKGGRKGEEGRKRREGGRNWPIKFLSKLA